MAGDADRQPGVTRVTAPQPDGFVARRAVWGLAIVLAVLGGILALELRGTPAIASRPAPFFLLLALFLAVEALRIDMQMGSSGYSITMSEVGLVVGVLTGRPFDTVVAHVVSALIVYGVFRRLPLAKLVFNTAQVAFVSGIGVLVYRAFDPGIEISPRAGFGALVVGLLVGLLDLSLLSLVSRLAGQRADWHVFGHELMYAVFSSVSSAAIGVQMVFLGRQSPWLVSLAAVPVGLLYAAFRSYAAQRRATEHSEFLHEASIALHDAPNLDDGLLALLEHTRVAVRAQFARIVLFTPDGAITVSSHVDPALAEPMSAATAELATAAQLLMHELSRAQLLDHPDTAGRALLGALGVLDGMACPVHRKGKAVGIAIVGNRLNRYAEFRGEDLRLVGLVANQIDLALEKGRLEQSVRQLVELESKLKHQANHDGLTGVANRRMFNERVETLFGRSDMSGVALLLIDLDDFKAINDAHGHLVGDEVLSVVAQRLHAGVRSGDLVARIGGDEFALVLQGVDTPATALQRAASVVDAMRRPLKVHDRVLSVRTSIGVALAERDVSDPGELLRNADTALYRAKALGKDGFVLFESSMHSEAHERRQLAIELTDAVRRRLFDVLYHPVHDLVTGDVVAVEALVRWNHPDRGPLMPSAFLDLAGEIGVAADLGLQVIADSVAEIGRLARRLTPDRPIRLNLNLSAQQIADPGLIPELLRRLHGAGLDPTLIAVEADESSFLADPVCTVRLVREAKTHGIRIALDDFGVGYSALGHVHDLAFDELKIDGTLVRAMTQDQRTAALVGSIVHFSNALDVMAIAEGIETTEQLHELRRLGCRYGQGYLLTPPLTPDELVAVVVGPRARPSWIS